MTARPRVTCPVCGRDVALTAKTGVIGPHQGIPGRQRAQWCEAKGTLTAEDAVRADLERLAELVAKYPQEAEVMVAQRRRARVRKGSAE